MAKEDTPIENASRENSSKMKSNSIDIKEKERKSNINIDDDCNQAKKTINKDHINIELENQNTPEINKEKNDNIASDGDNNKIEEEKIEEDSDELINAPSVSYFKLQFGISGYKENIYFIFCVIGGIAMGASFPLFSLIFGDALNNVSIDDYDALVDKMGDLAVKFVYVGLGMGVGTCFNGLFSELNNQEITKKMKKLYFETLLKQEQGFFDKKNCFEYATKVQTQIKAVNQGLGNKVGNSITGISTFIASYIIGFIVSWKLSLILLSIVPFLSISGALMVKQVSDKLKKSREAYEEAGGIAEEVLYNIKTVVSFGNFYYEKKRFTQRVNESYEKSKLSGLYASIFSGLIFLFIFGGYAMAVGVGSKFIADEDINGNTGDPFEVGDIITILFTIVFGAFYLGQVIPNIKAIASACEASREFFYLLERKPDIDLSLSKDKPDSNSIEANIVFDKVAFSYPSNKKRKILDNLNLTFEAGKSTAIVGETGSGKSTIVNLVERLYDPIEGNVLIDGKNIKEYDLEYFRSLIGYVPQEPILLHSSIKENIIFGRKNVTTEEIQEACDKALVSEFLERMDKGIDSKVGIRGSRLSGGQKQRVAIARAILKKPKILILDEATSALDYRTEKDVKRALDKVSKDITTIIIAHRLSTVRNAHKIIVLNKGEIAEVGTHQTLFDKQGLYYLLVKNQETADSKEIEEEVQIESNKTEDNNINNEIYLQSEAKQLKENDDSSSKKDNSTKVKQNLDYSINEEDMTLEERKKKRIEQDKKDEEKVKDAKQYLWPIMCMNPGALISATISVTTQGCCWPVYGILLAFTIEKLSNEDLEKVKDDGRFMAGMFIILALVAAMSNFVTGTLFTLLGENLAKQMRLKCYEKYLRLNMAFYDKIENSPGSLLTKLASDTLKLNGIAMSMFSIIIENIATLALGITLGFVYSWQIALICSASLPVIIFSSVAKMRMKYSSNKVDELNMEDLGNMLSESLTNTKSIFCYNMQEKATSVYADKVEEGAFNNCNLIVTNVLSGFSQFFSFGLYAICFYVGSLLVRDHGANYADFLKAMFAIMFCSVGVGMAQQYVGDMADAKKALISLYGVLNYQLDIDPFEGRNNYLEEGVDFNNENSFNEDNDNNKICSKIFATDKNIKGNIEFKNVSFSYPTRPDIKVFENLNLSIKEGESIAFVGFSGSGKSTIIQLILRFYDVNEGEIVVDGVNIKDYDLISYRKQLGLVMQEPALFKVNVYKNILYGKLNATETEILDAAIKSKVPRIDQIKLDDESALPVSGGEKQRIAIARCMLRNPKILLLDEATSALDKNVEEEVQKSLDVLMYKRTSIVVAHRLSTIYNSNCIFYLEKGKIIEMGTHDELINLKGRYFALYNSGTDKKKKEINSSSDDIAEVNNN